MLGQRRFNRQQQAANQVNGTGTNGVNGTHGLVNGVNGTHIAQRGASPARARAQASYHPPSRGALTNGINGTHAAVNGANGAPRGAMGTRGRPGPVRGLIRGGFSGSGGMPAAGGQGAATGGAGRGNVQGRGGVSGGSLDPRYFHANG
jgi:hypothetical protein